MAIGLGEACTPLGQAVDVGRLADRVAVAGQRRRGEVVRDDEEYVVFSRRGLAFGKQKISAQKQQGERKVDSFFHRLKFMKRIQRQGNANWFLLRIFRNELQKNYWQDC